MFPVGMLSIAPQLNIDENLAQDLSLLQFPPEVEPVVSGASICWGVISSLKMILPFLMKHLQFPFSPFWSIIIFVHKETGKARGDKEMTQRKI